MSRFKMRVAVHLILKNNNKVLLLRRYNTGYEDGNYSVVAGHVDGNETIISAMKREAKEEACIDIDEKDLKREALEEAGININEEDLKIVEVIHRKADDESIDYFLYCEKYTGNIIIGEPNKCDELKFYEIDKLPKNTIPYIKQAIENHKNGVEFSTFGF